MLIKKELHHLFGKRRNQIHQMIEAHSLTCGKYDHRNNTYVAKWNHYGNTPTIHVFLQKKNPQDSLYGKQKTRKITPFM